ncbi:MAG: hypothetical protein ACXVHI_01335 [Frankiaceae bacterium]
MPFVYLRDEVVPDDTRLMIRAGVTGLRPEKLRADALDAAEEIGIIGVSVIAALPRETLEEACRGTRLLANRRVVWWATAGPLRAARFPLLATARNERHYTIALATLDDGLLNLLATLFTKEERQL